MFFIHRDGRFILTASPSPPYKPLPALSRHPFARWRMLFWCVDAMYSFRKIMSLVLIISIMKMQQFAKKTKASCTWSPAAESCPTAHGALFSSHNDKPRRGSAARSTVSVSNPLDRLCHRICAWQVKGRSNSTQPVSWLSSLEKPTVTRHGHDARFGSLSP